MLPVTFVRFIVLLLAVEILHATFLDPTLESDSRPIFNSREPILRAADHERSELMFQYVKRSAAHNSDLYKDYEDPTEQDYFMSGRKMTDQRKSFKDQSKSLKDQSKSFKDQSKSFKDQSKGEVTRSGRQVSVGEAEEEKSPQESLLFCFKVCNSLIFEVYQLLGGNICNCDK